MPLQPFGPAVQAPWERPGGGDGMHLRPFGPAVQAPWERPGGAHAIFTAVPLTVTIIMPLASPITS